MTDRNSPKSMTSNMALTIRQCVTSSLCGKRVTPQCLSQMQLRFSNTLANITVERHRKSKLAHDREEASNEKHAPAPRNYKHVFPEFLPNPTWYLRDRVLEKLERRDMLRRRAVLHIPEFYVGSILAVTVADPYASGKRNRFVGICIDRYGCGLKARFILRNVIDGLGVEIMYDLYSPALQMVEVLKLEKRLDDELYYLRDAAPEHSTIPVDMEAVPHPPGADVPLNQTKVELGPLPWHVRWERYEFKGIIVPPIVPQWRMDRIEINRKPWEKYDLMKQYRGSINDMETDEIMSEVHTDMQEVVKQHRKKRFTTAAQSVKSKS